jgi:hypothetical protein
VAAPQKIQRRIATVFEKRLAKKRPKKNELRKQDETSLSVSPSFWLQHASTVKQNPVGFGSNMKLGNGLLRRARWRKEQSM